MTIFKRVLLSTIERFRRLEGKEQDSVLQPHVNSTHRRLRTIFDISRKDFD